MSQVISIEKIKESNKSAINPNGYFIQTWGCQMNVEDSEQLELQLQALGYSPADSPKTAKVILLNTCSVRKKPEDKAFSFLGELALLKRTNQDAIIGVCGCMAQARANEILRRAPHVDFVLGTGDLSELTGLVIQAAQGKRFMKRVELPERKGAIVTDVPKRTLPTTNKLKAFVPIQYGCDKFCTFCIVPMTRGRERSRPTAEVIDEVQHLTRMGTKEITLLGQTVNSYGKNLLEGRVPFSDLLWQLSEIPGLERIRYISPYPRDFTHDLIQTIKDNPKVVEHVHLPLQAGHNNTLKRMKRLYTVESFTEIINELRLAIPGIGITTDIIVGFPEESDEEFDATLALIEKLRFDGAYCFAYSTRPGTPAATMEQVPQVKKMQRLNHLIDLQNKITLEINRELVGRKYEVLIEGPSAKDKSMLHGRTREYRSAIFKGNQDRIGRLAEVIVRDTTLTNLVCDLV